MAVREVYPAALGEENGLRGSSLAIEKTEWRCE
jgi:hypothetical protein